MTDATKGRILIVDDDEQVRVAHQRLLEKAGYDVRTSRSPFEGLELVHISSCALDLETWRMSSTRCA